MKNSQRRKGSRKLSWKCSLNRHIVDPETGEESKDFNEPVVVGWVGGGWVGINYYNRF